jgi:predicted short-subunit dehydrogenase-like oxidoreductase (DUF2520 family)
MVLIAVPDAAIVDVAGRLARLEPASDLSFVHLSGATKLSALDALAPRPRGSFHPLQTFPFPREPGSFRGITIAVDATTPALRRRLNALARRLGARPHSVGDADRAVYHAAGAYASNFVLVMIAEAVRLLEGAGWTEKEATRALMPLVDGAVENIKRKGVVAALTGPIRRGDAETVRRHLEVVGNPDLYRMLGEIALEIAREAGLGPAAAESVNRALTRKVAATRRRRRR